jgi:hypothetical protein
VSKLAVLDQHFLFWQEKAMIVTMMTLVLNAAQAVHMSAVHMSADGEQLRLSPGRGSFSILDFGADPTGAADSTIAIQAAVKAAMDNTTHRTVSTVVFPVGTYLLTQAGNLSGTPPGDKTNVYLRGSGGVPEVQQTCSGCDVFYGANLWRFEARDLWLRGGRHQLSLGNRNINQGFFLVENVQFENSSGIAINIHGGTPSTKLVVRGCQFNACDQVLVNHCDWSSFESSWIEASCSTGAKAVIENHNHLFVRDILGVPCNHQPGHQPSLTRWFDNYGPPGFGGFLHVRNMRFGGEMGGFLAVMNFAPYLCHEVFSPTGSESCGTVNKSGAPLPPKIRTSEAASIILEGCALSGAYGHAHGAEIYLMEVPAQLVVRDCWMQSQQDNATQQLVKLDPAIDLNGPYLVNSIAASESGRPRFELSGNNWGIRSQQNDLPEQLRPFLSGRIEADAAPISGLWRGGQVVWNRRAAAGAWAGAAPQPAGWYCAEGGTPGVWVNVSMPL